MGLAGARSSVAISSLPCTAQFGFVVKVGSAVVSSSMGVPSYVVKTAVSPGMVEKFASSCVKLSLCVNWGIVGISNLSVASPYRYALTTTSPVFTFTRVGLTYPLFAFGE